MSTFEQIFVEPLRRSIEAKRVHRPPVDWRPAERVIIGFFKSYGFLVRDIAAEPFIEAVRYYEADEAIISKASLEQLAKLLAEEFGR
jgi:hypothetical protein